MNRRKFLMLGTAVLGASAMSFRSFANSPQEKNMALWDLNNADWKKRLTPAQYHILREEGTEKSFSSQLNTEKRVGTYHCAGCDLPLFHSGMKYDSKTGWPSFFTFVPNSLDTKIDFKLIYPRTEYHCVRCGGHQGHVFKDGPKPTGKRYCNNGLALTFVAA